MGIKEYFIPCEKNDYHPGFKRPVSIAVFTLVIWGIRIFTPVEFSLAAPGIDPELLMQKINNERTRRFIPALVTNQKLAVAATGKSNDMLARGYFDHVDPDGNYVWSRIEAAGYTPYLTLGENLAMDFFDADSVVSAWMSSPSHRTNVLNEKFQDQGLASVYGTFQSSHDSILITSLFGSLLQQTQAQKESPPPATTTHPAIVLPAETPPPAENNPPPVPPSSPSVPPSSPPIGSEIQINSDIKISKTTVHETVLIEIDAIVSGQPEIVTATIGDKTSTLLPSAIPGQFLGVISFEKPESYPDLLVVTAQSESGAKTNEEFVISNFLQPALPGSQSESGVVGANEIEFIKILRLVLGILAGLFVFFLLLDSLIVHRAKIKQRGANNTTHGILFLLIFLVNLFASWF